MTGVSVRNDRSVTRVFGRDPVKMIQGLATNDVAGAAEGVSVYTAFLNPKGKMVGDARVVRLGSDVFIEADRAATANIRDHLKKSVPPLFARFEAQDQLGVVSVYGERAQEIVDQLQPKAQLRNVFRKDEVSVIVDDVDAAVARAAELGAQMLSDDVAELMRIEAGEPKWGAELAEDVIPIEAGLRHVAISESKGCYTGQEVIIRILHRGHVNRHLRGFTMHGDVAPEVGTEIFRQGESKSIGRVTSARYSSTRNGIVGLAYVRREVEMPATLSINNHDATVYELGSTAAGVAQ